MKKIPRLFAVALFMFIMTSGFVFAQASPSDASASATEYLGFWKNVRVPEDFPAWRQSIVDYYRKAIRISIDYQTVPLDLKYIETKEIAPGVMRYRVDYNATDSLRIPAYLFVPKTDKPVPAVIVYHGHGDGKINSAEREGTNENALARYLAVELGYVVLAPDSRSFGEFKIPGVRIHSDYFQGLAASRRLYMTKLMLDGYQDMALLRSLPQVDPARIGVAGISMGSWRALNHAVLHDDIRAVVVAGLFIPWDYLFSFRHCSCQHITRLAGKMKMEDFTAAVFPRDLMVQWGLDDGYHAQGAEPLIERTAKIADFIGASSRFVVDRHPGMGHRFSNPDVARFMRNSLGAGAWEPKSK